MKRSGGTGRQPAKRAKNVYSLQSFGHSLRVSQPAPAPAPPVARAGNLSSDRRRADVQLIPLRQNPRPSVLSTDSNDDAWVDVADPPDNDTATLGHDAGLPARRKRKRKWYATTVSFGLFAVCAAMLIFGRTTASDIGLTTSATRIFEC
jgi:hypothetical protein